MIANEHLPDSKYYRQINLDQPLGGWKMIALKSK